MTREARSNDLAAESFDRLFALSPDLLCVAGTDGYFKHVNPAFERLLGFTEEELLERPFVSFIHPDDRQLTAEASGELAGGHEVIDFENRYRCKDGSVRWIQWRAGAASESGFLYAVGRDVTETRRAARLLEQTQATARIGGWELDLASGHLYWTDEAYRLHETSPASYRPDLESWVGFFAETSRPAIAAGLRRARDLGEGLDLEAEVLTARERSIWVRVVGRPRIEDGDTVKVVGSVQDVTRQRETDQARRRLEAQLLHSQKLEAVGRLAGGVAHDFNNLLTAILGNAEIAAAVVGPGSEVEEFLHGIVGAAERAAELTGQLLAFARRQVIDPKVSSLDHIVRSIETLLRGTLGESIALELRLSPQPWLVRVDPGQLEQIIVHLAVNARDALPTGGRFVISTHNLERGTRPEGAPATLADGEYVLLEAQDDGGGMDESTRVRVFEPFFTSKELGTGLGLSTCHGIVEQHDGSIWVRSRPGEGATFSIALPRVEAGEVVSLPAPESAVGTETVLLVEDEKVVRDVAVLGLESAGYTVLSARSGEEGVRIAGNHPGPIHVLVTDVVLPGIAGDEVASVVRAARPDVTVLYTSGYTHAAIADRGVLAEGLDFLAKPYTPARLAEEVRRVLDARTSDDLPSSRRT